jgi:hypothetical protein
LFTGSTAAGKVPECEALNQALANGILQHCSKPVRFVPAEQLPAVAYEKHIFHSGEVSTREDNWHDLFNALVWARFPRIKLALNAQHVEQVNQGHEVNRGPVRDALTLFDECGVIVIGDQPSALQAMAMRDWRQLFCTHRAAWQSNLRVFVLGHALLEKFLEPYKAITAQVLIFQCGTEFFRLDDAAQAERVDTLLARQIAAGMRLRSTGELSPLPLMGIPGWWPDGPQDEAFYADQQVFREAPAGFRPATIHPLEAVS